MRFLSLFLFLLFPGVAIGQQDTAFVAFQKEINLEFKDAATSPLSEKDREKFKALDFFRLIPTSGLKLNF
jgi:hypothetical protein